MNSLLIIILLVLIVLIIIIALSWGLTSLMLWSFQPKKDKRKEQKKEKNISLMQEF